MNEAPIDTDEFVKNLFTDIPERLTPLREMESPNQVLPLYAGTFSLLTDGNTYQCEGKIEFRWLPTLGIYFSGVTTAQHQLILDHNNSVIFDIEYDGKNVGKAISTGIKWASGSSEMPLYGQLLSTVENGDTSITVETIQFDIPNLGKFIGESIKSGTAVSNARLVLEDDDYVIYIDQVKNFSEQTEKVCREGGFILTGCGSIQKKTGTISLAEGQSVAIVLRYFLSFLSGRRTAPMFLTGVSENNIVWSHYNAADVDAYQAVHSWRPQVLRHGIENMWRSFSRLLLMKEGNDWLTTSIQWYMEANKRGGRAEGSIMIIQCALEMLCNRILIEDKKVISLSKASKMGAAEKIRLLLSTMKIDANIPCNLLPVLGSISDGDGPDVLVEIRNAIVHGQKKKRKKLKEVPAVVFGAVLNLGIFYIEMLLLKVTGYRGEYFDRTDAISYVAPTD